MPVHFAAARSRAMSPIARIVGNGRTGMPANDEPGVPRPSIDAATEAALRHFAQHGLGAAAVALDKAEQSRQADDHQAASAWLDLCYRLDRQAAIRFERSNESLIG